MIPCYQNYKNMLHLLKFQVIRWLCNLSFMLSIECFLLKQYIYIKRALYDFKEQICIFLNFSYLFYIIKFNTKTKNDVFFKERQRNFQSKVTCIQKLTINIDHKYNENETFLHLSGFMNRCKE